MMSHSPNKDKNANSNPSLKPAPVVPPAAAAIKRSGTTLSLPEIWYKQRALKHVIVKMAHQSLSATSSPSPPSEHDTKPLQHSVAVESPAPDYTSLLSDELLLNIFSKLPVSQHVPNSLVCKRWSCLHGRLVRSLKLTDFGFLDSGRIFYRFPNLTDVDIVLSCVKTARNSGIFVSNKSLSVHIGTEFSPNGFIDGNDLLPRRLVDRSLKLLAGKYPNLRRIAVIDASEDGLTSIAQECVTLQELELHCCGDLSLKGICGCKNLQVVKLIGCVDGFYSSVVTDIGLTFLAHGCRRLVKLELCGCEGSYDGIKAIGQCCQMLEDLTIRDHRMDGGWLAALSFCVNLKTLRLHSCKVIDLSPGPDEHLGSCLTLEELHLQQCQVRDKQSVKALFLVCEPVREIVLQDCWGMVDEVFSLVSICRRVKLLSLEGCSLLTTGGLESVILFWNELQSLRVIACNNIKDSEVTPALASLFSDLKELKWRPDSKYLLSAGLSGTGVGKKGGRFFKGLKA